MLLVPRWITLMCRQQVQSIAQVHAGKVQESSDHGRAASMHPNDGSWHSQTASVTRGLPKSPALSNLLLWRGAGATETEGSEPLCPCSCGTGILWFSVAGRMPRKCSSACARIADVSSEMGHTSALTHSQHEDLDYPQLLAPSSMGDKDERGMRAHVRAGRRRRCGRKDGECERRPPRVWLGSRNVRHKNT
jgi:hypothetical protein